VGPAENELAFPNGIPFENTQRFDRLEDNLALSCSGSSKHVYGCVVFAATDGSLVDAVGSGESSTPGTKILLVTARNAALACKADS
jgi:hypothetical protein